MGSDKGFLSLPGAEHITFAERLIASLVPLCSEVLLVARDQEQAAAYATLSRMGVRLVTDHQADIGPLMGLQSGLSAMSATHALVTAVDMPFVQPALLKFLLAQPFDESIHVPLVDGVPQVLLALYPRAILPALQERLRAGRRDPRSLLDVVPVHYIEEAQLRQIDPRLRSFVNINTPQELASSLSGNLP